MNKIIIVAALSITLAGCVVPHPVYVEPLDPVYEYEPVVVYPVYQSAYVWDAGSGTYFFYDGGYQRHYMPGGWAYGHPIPGPRFAPGAGARHLVPPIPGKKGNYIRKKY